MIDGLKEAIRIIEKEIEYAKTANQQMALGMSQVRDIIEIRRAKEVYKYGEVIGNIYENPELLIVEKKRRNNNG